MGDENGGGQNQVDIIDPTITDGGDIDDNEFDVEVDGEIDQLEIIKNYTIALDTDKIIFEGTSAEVNGTTITIKSAGEYYVKGVLNNGCIIIDVTKDEEVTLILDNVKITNENGCCVYGKSSDKIIVKLAKNSNNVLIDGTTYSYLEDDFPKVCIYSKDDLTISGDGKLYVYGRYNNGIATTNDLKITNGEVVVKTLNNALKGNDSVEIKKATIVLESQDDAIKVENEEDTNKGYFLIESGILNVSAVGDGIQSSQLLQIDGGTINIKTTGDLESDATFSSKALKSVGTILINGGTITITSADDDLHSDGNIIVNDGMFEITTDYDDLQAEATINIVKGNFVIKTNGGSEKLHLVVVHHHGILDGVQA